MMDAQKTIDAILTWLKQGIPDTQALLIPVSGGSDSAFCFWLCNQVFQERVKGVFVGSELRSKEWFEATGTVEYVDIPMDSENPEVARWACFLTLSLKENRVLIGSRNLTEHTLGTFSNASRVAAFLPLAGLWKHEVMELCEYVGIPTEITESSRRADPECGRPQKLADIAYTAVDRYLQTKLGGAVDEKLDIATPEQVEYLESVYLHNAYKTTLPLVGPTAMALRSGSIE